MENRGGDWRLTWLGVILFVIVVIGFRLFGITATTIWAFNFFDLVAMLLMFMGFLTSAWFNDLRLNSPRLVGLGINTTTDMNRIKRVGDHWLIPGGCMVARGFQLPVREKNIEEWFIIPRDHAHPIREEGIIITCDTLLAPSMYHMPSDCRNKLITIVGRLTGKAENNYGRGWRHKLQVYTAWPANIESIVDRLIVTEYLDEHGNLAVEGGDGWSDAEYSNQYRDPMYDYLTSCPGCNDAWNETKRLRVQVTALEDASEGNLEHTLNQIVGWGQVVEGAGRAAKKTRWWPSIKKEEE